MSKKMLIDNIKIEFDNIERIIREKNELLGRINDKPDFIETRGAASILHDFYSGIEKIFERISTNIDNYLSKSENWHIELLSQMAKPFTNIRGPVISEDSFKRLQEYLKFRHLFRHIYGFELDWERFRELFMNMEEVYKKIKTEIEDFLERM